MLQPEATKICRILHLLFCPLRSCTLTVQQNRSMTLQQWGMNVAAVFSAEGLRSSGGGGGGGGGQRGRIKRGVLLCSSGARSHFQFVLHVLSAEPYI